MHGDIVNTLFALIMAVTLVALLWGLVMYYAEIGSEEAKKEYKSLIILSITVLVLLMCLYAGIEWVRGALGV